MNGGAAIEFKQGAPGELDKDLLQRYLLGDLSESEQEGLERECGANEALSEALQTAESDLIDSYVLRELSEAQVRQFESCFLNSSERLLRVEIARSLMSSSVREKVPVGPIEEAKPKSAWWSLFFSQRIAFASAAVFVAAAAVFLLLENQRLRHELDRSTMAQRELQSRIENLQGHGQRPVMQNHDGLQAQAEPTPLPPTSTASLLLSPGLLRNGGRHQNQVLTLSPAVSAVVLMLMLESTASGPANPAEAKDSRYDVILQTVDGRMVRSLRGLTSQRAPDGGPMVAARLPSQLLDEGDYIVTLLGQTNGKERRELASYSFTVTR
jgi:hypothetical protein